MPPLPHNLPVGIDGRMLGAGGTGVSSYARALAQAQKAIGSRHVVVHDESTLNALPPHQGRLRRWARALLPVAAAGALRPTGDEHEQFIVGHDLFRLAQVFFDVHRRPLSVSTPGISGIMHWSYPVPIRLAGWKNVYTVHDAIPLMRPDLTDIDPGRHRRLLLGLCRSAARLVTVSEAARGEIVDSLKCRPDFVMNCGVAVEPSMPSDAALPAGLLPRAYLLVCGTVEPRKNIAAILEAHRLSGTKMPLVVAGPETTRDAALEAAVRAAGAVRLKDLPTPDMISVIAQARALIMPSLAEGFGLPVAEAMALGTPVITSHAGALAETACGAALLVDPASIDAIAGAIARIAQDDALWHHLVNAGRLASARFSRPRFSERLSELYRTL
jgi:glycosyltransferase involved in cell wall biosynthesis